MKTLTVADFIFRFSIAVFIHPNHDTDISPFEIRKNKDTKTKTREISNTSETLERDPEGTHWSTRGKRSALDHVQKRFEETYLGGMTNQKGQD